MALQLRRRLLIQYVVSPFNEYEALKGHQGRGTAADRGRWRLPLDNHTYRMAQRAVWFDQLYRLGHVYALQYRRQRRVDLDDAITHYNARTARLLAERNALEADMLEQDREARDADEARAFAVEKAQRRRELQFRADYAWRLRHDRPYLEALSAASASWPTPATLAAYIDRVTTPHPSKVGSANMFGVTRLDETAAGEPAGGTPRNPPGRRAKVAYRPADQPRKPPQPEDPRKDPESARRLALMGRFGKKEVGHFKGGLRWNWYFV